MNGKGELQIVQWDAPPMVYLDHWAFRKFSQNRTLADRLTAAIKLRNGTLALSWLNLDEFTKVTMEEQARHAEDLVEAIPRQIFWIELEPFTVIERENNLLSGGPPVPPHGDAEFLKALPKLKATSLNLYTVRGLFTAMQGRRDATNFDRLADVIIGRLETMRDEYVIDQEFQSAVRRPVRRFRSERGVFFVS